MKIFITGATGFIGQNLVQDLIDNGHRCRCLVRDLDKARTVLGEHPNLDLRKGDVTIPETLAGLADQIDCVFHLAALMGHDLPSETAFKKFRKINVAGTQHLLDECRGHLGIQKIIHVSSTAAYGILNEHVITEKTQCRPYTPYQVSKHESDQVALSYAKQGLPILVIRPCMIYGPGFKGDFLTMAKVAKRGVYPKIGLGKNLAPSLYITDLIAALLLAIDYAKPGETYLIGPAQSASQKEILKIMESFLRKKIWHLYIPTVLAKCLAWLQEKICHVLHKKPLVTARNIGSITHDRILDISKARNELHYDPKIDLATGLTKTLQWYQDEGML